MSKDPISVGCEVEHEDTGQVGIVVAHIYERRCEDRWTIEWRDKTYETPVGVPSSKLIRLRGPRTVKT